VKEPACRVGIKQINYDEVLAKDEIRPYEFQTVIENINMYFCVDIPLAIEAFPFRGQG
jgi:hypothetical protein